MHVVNIFLCFNVVLLVRARECFLGFNFLGSALLLCCGTHIVFILSVPLSILPMGVSAHSLTSQIRDRARGMNFHDASRTVASALSVILAEACTRYLQGREFDLGCEIRECEAPVEVPCEAPAEVPAVDVRVACALSASGGVAVSLLLVQIRCACRRRRPAFRAVRQIQGRDGHWTPAR